MKGHYIPRFILNKFSPSSMPGMILIYNKEAGNTRPRPIASSFQGENLFGVYPLSPSGRRLGGINLSFENTLGKLENKAKLAIERNIICAGARGRLAIHISRRKALALLLNLNPLRNPYVIYDDLISKGLYCHAEMHLRMLRNPDSDNEFRKYIDSSRNETVKALNDLYTRTMNSDIVPHFKILQNPNQDTSFLIGTYSFYRISEQAIHGWMPVSPSTAILLDNNLSKDKIIVKPALVRDINRYIFENSRHVVVQSKNFVPMCFD